ncbi:MAG: hypothetical protein OQK95_12095 [Gammaproteobacteria bacterium]|nr:hypothetical protein [Gammaproteobacteria bacterium]MCW9030575.1 hypothetical protein [Gammaproteobacteria bacterium]
MKKYHPILMSWIPLKNGLEHKVPYLRDHFLNPIESMFQFFIAISEWKYTYTKNNDRIQSYKSFVDIYAYALKSFVEYLAYKNISWDEVTSEHLDEFYDWEIPRIMMRSATKHNEKAAKRTCNRKLTAIYQFYGWAHSFAKLLPYGYVGENGNIKTTIPLAYEEGLLKGPLFKVSNKLYPKISIGLYPLIRTHVGEPIGDYCATDKDIEMIVDYFIDNSANDYVSARNILIISIIDSIGLRSNSISSLTIKQFSCDILEQCEDETIDIIPSSQKFGYNNSFPFPTFLISQILDFIENDRAELMRTLGLNELKVKHALFLTQDGNTLTPKRISEIIAKGFQAIGHKPGKGAAAHSGRRKRAKDVTYEELAWRARSGMPIDPVTVSQTVATNLGQKDFNSAALYHKASHKMREENLETKLARQNAELIGELNELKREKAYLESLLRKANK